MNLLNKESVVPEVPRTVGPPPAPGEARGPQFLHFLTFFYYFWGSFFWRERAHSGPDPAAPAGPIDPPAGGVLRAPPVGLSSCPSGAPGLPKSTMPGRSQNTPKHTKNPTKTIPKPSPTPPKTPRGVGLGWFWVGLGGFWGVWGGFGGVLGPRGFQ